MADKKREQELGEAARKLLLAGEHRQAEYMLWEIVRTAPRAPTTTYLLGLSILYQRRFREARRLIDRAYELRLWVNDRIVMPFTVEILADAAAAQPDWEWPRYQRARERWRSVGLTVTSAMNHLAKVADAVPTFVQVGANDGRRGDPIYELVRDLGLRGLLVEPQPEPFATLEKNYEGVEGLRFENAAVTDEDGPAEMVTTLDRSTIGSMTPTRNILKLRKEQELAKIVVAGLTFDSIMKRQQMDRFDLLQIDTEGFDYRVLRQVDLRRRGVKVVNLEYYCLPVSERLAACEQLDAADFVWDFGRMDLLAVRRDVFEDAFCVTEMTAEPPPSTEPTRLC